MIKSKRITDIILIIVTLILTVPLILIISILIFCLMEKVSFMFPKELAEKIKFLKCTNLEQ